jgi:hypothetical protein
MRETSAAFPYMLKIQAACDILRQGLTLFRRITVPNCALELKIPREPVCLNMKFAMAPSHRITD